MKRWNVDSVFFAVNRGDWEGNVIFDELPKVCYMDWDDDYPVRFYDDVTLVTLGDMLERIRHDTMPTAQ